MEIVQVGLALPIFANRICPQTKRRFRRHTFNRVIAIGVSFRVKLFRFEARWKRLGEIPFHGYSQQCTHCMIGQWFFIFPKQLSVKLPRRQQVNFNAFVQLIDQRDCGSLRIFGICKNPNGRRAGVKTELAVFIGFQLHSIIGLTVDRAEFDMGIF